MRCRLSACAKIFSRARDGLGWKLPKFLTQRVHQRPERLLGEIKPNPCRRKEFRQRPRPAERQCGAIIRQRPPWIFLALEPKLQRPQLCDSVLDVIKRRM